LTTFTSEDLKNAMKDTTSQETFDALKQSQIVAEAPYHPGYEDAPMHISDKGYEEKNLAEALWQKKQAQMVK
jgi:hypothetical protein